MNLLLVLGAQGRFGSHDFDEGLPLQMGRHEEIGFDCELKQNRQRSYTHTHTHTTQRKFV